MRILIVTHIPSPYQVELFDKIAANQSFVLHVLYLHSSSYGRTWSLPTLRHANTILENAKTNFSLVEEMIQTFDLVIFNYYHNATAQLLMKRRVKSKKPWCYWGERPGYHQWGIAGRIYRRLTLFHLFHSKMPIWGIGEWAVDQYRKEFGTDRLYLNYSYFSDLERFKLTKQLKDHSKFTQFLYSGVLSKRKGVDILAKAFSRLASEKFDVRLNIMGDGPLKGYLENQMKSLNSQVKFLGFQQWDALPQYYSNADILCVPSRYDGWGLVVPEGLAAGLPVISTNRTGSALELIKPNWNGWLVDKYNVDELYHTMQQAAMLSSSELEFYANNARISTTNYSLEAGVKRFSQCVEETMDVCNSL